MVFEVIQAEERLINLASGFEVVNTLEAVVKECLFGEGRSCLLYGFLFVICYIN